MNDLDQRLAQCFAIAFPGLSETDAINATPATVEAWDSIGAINLASVIGEEFAIEIDLELLPDLISFGAFRQVVEAQVADGRAPEHG